MVQSFALNELSECQALALLTRSFGQRAQYVRYVHRTLRGRKQQVVSTAANRAPSRDCLSMRLQRGCRSHPTGEIGPGVGFVPGDGGEGTSMSGACVGMPGGGSVGWPGCEG
jgi:hypothetical protein